MAMRQQGGKMSLRIQNQNNDREISIKNIARTNKEQIIKLRVHTGVISNLSACVNENAKVQMSVLVVSECECVSMCVQMVCCDLKNSHV
jgi:hypothetical protein